MRPEIDGSADLDALRVGFILVFYRLWHQGSFDFQSGICIWDFGDECFSGSEGEKTGVWDLLGKWDLVEK